MTATDVEVGKAYVVTMETVNLGRTPRVAMCTGKTDDGAVLVRSRMGSFNTARWARKPTRVSADNVRREATAREVLVNMVVGSAR